MPLTLETLQTVSGRSEAQSLDPDTTTGRSTHEPAVHRASTLGRRELSRAHGGRLGFGAWMVLAGLACLVHGVLPFMFVKTGSRTIAMLHDRMIANRVRNKPLPEGAGGSSAT